MTGCSCYLFRDGSEAIATLNLRIGYAATSNDLQRFVETVRRGKSANLDNLEGRKRPQPEFSGHAVVP